ncbi:hypothetical protein Ade02nite_00150 [Paractinoplanes deccanensis]|uniref:Uncharacterized protein n=1 Tax=Paractinoplanes deccanensis TaxID=113561 RepID=A0ABQ3XUE7_9ACTN|nr:hypothetical protein [Actinoplanes deccanensis]GID71374.1 hypothetical protein Ade02nite_00150 [Actinoplanes deccanensis]
MEFARRRKVETSFDLRPAEAAKGRLQAGPAQRQIRKPRHAGLFQAVHRLDAGLDPAARAQLAEWIRGEYQSEFGDVPLGLFALCHLGPPYIDHRLDLWQSIVEHYAPADAVPQPYAQARMLVRSGAYDFVEVYASGELRPVLKDGSVVA